MEKKPDILGAKTVKDLARHVDDIYDLFITKMNNLDKHQGQMKARQDITIALLFVILASIIAGNIGS